MPTLANWIVVIAKDKTNTIFYNVGNFGKRCCGVWEGEESSIYQRRKVQIPRTLFYCKFKKLTSPLKRETSHHLLSHEKTISTSDHIIGWISWSCPNKRCVKPTNVEHKWWMPIFNEVCNWGDTETWTHFLSLLSSQNNLVILIQHFTQVEQEFQELPAYPNNHILAAYLPMFWRFGPYWEWFDKYNLDCS